MSSISSFHLAVLGGGVIAATYITGGESAGQKGQGGVSTNARELDSKVEDDILVDLLGVVGGRILVLRDGSDLCVVGSLVAVHASKTDGAGVLLKGTVEQGIGETSDSLILVVEREGVGESLVGNDLLETVQIGHITSTISGGGGTEETEDGVNNVETVVELEDVLGGSDNGLMRLLLRDLGGGEGHKGGQDSGRLLHCED